MQDKKTPVLESFFLKVEDTIKTLFLISLGSRVDQETTFKLNVHTLPVMGMIQWVRSTPPFEKSALFEKKIK